MIGDQNLGHQKQTMLLESELVNHTNKNTSQMIFRVKKTKDGLETQTRDEYINN